MKKIEYYRNKNVIHRQLKAVRRNRKMSQAELAAKMQTRNVNMDQQMISKIENNMRMVTDYELACFCSVLNVEERILLKDIHEGLRF